jgi:sulfur carrier protein
VIRVNGDERELPAGGTVAALLAELGSVPVDGRGVAVAVDGEVVPRSAWSDARLSDGARIEVLTAVQGG